jgi:hypothetical protein
MVGFPGGAKLLVEVAELRLATDGMEGRHVPRAAYAGASADELGDGFVFERSRFGQVGEEPLLFRGKRAGLGRRSCAKRAIMRASMASVLAR